MLTAPALPQQLFPLSEGQPERGVSSCDERSCGMHGLSEGVRGWFRGCEGFPSRAILSVSQMWVAVT